MFKGGYGATQMLAVAPGGEAVSYSSPGGSFAGSAAGGGILDYQANRGLNEWHNIALNPPSTTRPYAFVQDGFLPSGEESLWDVPLEGENSALAQATALKQQFFVRRADGFHAVGPVLQRVDEQKPFEVVVLGESNDFCHIVIESVPALAEVTKGAGAPQFYDLDNGCITGGPSLQVITLNNAGLMISPSCQLRSGKLLPHPFNAVADDGSVVFFEDHVSQLCGLPQDEQLFARVGDARTLEVSRPLEAAKPFGGCGEGGKPGEVPGEVPCSGAGSRPPAAFQGAADDGSVVYFTTEAQLDPAEDHDGGVDLYAARIRCPGEAANCPAAERTVASLVQVSHDPNVDEEAAVQGVVAVSHDGSHVYFVARGLLSSEGPAAAAAQAQPVTGADNLYTYERDSRYPAGHTEFVADICSGPALSGSVRDSRCPEDLEETSPSSLSRNDLALMGTEPLAQTVGAEGRMLLLSAYGQLIDSGPEADTDDAQDVYRFDPQSKGLVRISVGEGGADRNGNGTDDRPVGAEGKGLDNSDARIQTPNNLEAPNEERTLLRQAATPDGARVVFSTAEPLSEHGSNGLPDIYEWHEGRVTLISTGSSAEADEFPVIDPSGRDVFFVTAQGLVPQDTDGAPDIYDARIDGGFPSPPVPAEQCKGDACQGPLTNPEPLLVPASATQAPGENLPAPKRVVTLAKRKAPAHKGKRRSKKMKGKVTRSVGRSSKTVHQRRRGGAR